MSKSQTRQQVQRPQEDTRSIDEEIDRLRLRAYLRDPGSGITRVTQLGPRYAECREAVEAFLQLATRFAEAVRSPLAPGAAEVLAKSDSAWLDDGMIDGLFSAAAEAGEALLKEDEGKAARS